MAVEDRIQDTIRGTAAGVAENLYGQKPELARESANSFEDALRSMFEDEPYKRRTTPISTKPTTP